MDVTFSRQPGQSFMVQGKLVEAKAMYERVLARKEKALGPEHMSTLRMVNKLGHLHKDQSKLAEAKAMYERALAKKEKTLGPKSCRRYIQSTTWAFSIRIRTS